MTGEMELTPQRPYFIRALHDWCSDNGLTPYLVVKVDGSVRVPREYIRDGVIVLNISSDATGHLDLGNEYIEFKARFNGRLQDISVPVDRVAAIYARENGEGMSFPVNETDGAPDMTDTAASDASTAQHTPKQDNANEASSDDATMSLPEKDAEPAQRKRPVFTLVK